MADILFADIPATTLKAGTDIVRTSGRTAIGKASGFYVSDALATPALAAAHPRFAATSANNRVFRALPEDGRISVELGGATGNGATDDRIAIQSAISYSAAIGARGVSFGSAVYSTVWVPNAEHDYGNGPQPRFLLSIGQPPIDGGGAQINLTGGSRCFVFGYPWTGAVHAEVAADIPSGSQAVTLTGAGAASLAVGDEVVWQLGELPYDTPETLNWGFARIIEKTGSTVKLDRPIPEGFALASVTGFNKRLSKIPLLRDFYASDLTLVAPTGAEEAFTIIGGERITLERVGARNVGLGVFGAKFCDGITLIDCWAEGTVLTQASFGASFGFASCRNVQLIRPRARGSKHLISCEAGSEAQVVGASFDNTITDANGAPLGNLVKVFQALGRARISAHDTTVTGFGGYNLAEIYNGQPGYEGHISLTGRTRLIHPTDPWLIPLQQMSGTLDMTIAGVRETYNLDKLRHWRRRFTLRDGEFLTVLGPSGILVKARAYASPNLSIGPGQQLAAFTVGRQGDNGGNIVAGAHGGLTAGVDCWLDVFGGGMGGLQWAQRLLPIQMNVTTATAGGLNAANEFVEFEGWFAEPEFVDRATSEVNWRGMGAERDPFEALFPAYDLPPIAAGAIHTEDFAIPDMAAGDLIEAVSISTGLSGLSIRSAEAIAGAARIVFENQTVAAIDKGPAELRIAFGKFIQGT